MAAARLQRRHRELQQGRSTGMWRVHLLAGGDTPAAAAAVAGLLCASADLGRQPYALAPTGVRGGLDTVLALDDVPDSPVLAGSPLLASLAVAPAGEVPGSALRDAVRIRRHAGDRPDASRTSLASGRCWTAPTPRSARWSCPGAA